jgi:hypothetical protein
MREWIVNLGVSLVDKIVRAAIRSFSVGIIDSTRETHLRRCQTALIRLTDTWCEDVDIYWTGGNRNHDTSRLRSGEDVELVAGTCRKEAGLDGEPSCLSNVLKLFSAFFLILILALNNFCKFSRNWLSHRARRVGKMRELKTPPCVQTLKLEKPTPVPCSLTGIITSTACES